MQQAHESRDGTAPPSSSRSALAPVPVFLALAAVVALGVLGYYLLSPSKEAPATELGPPEDAFALTDQEAITEFNRLHELFLRSYRERDPSLTGLFTGPDARRAFSRVDQEIRVLIDDGVLDRTVFETQDLTVLSNTSSEIQLEQTLIVRRRYLDEKSGRNITLHPEPEQQTVTWTLRLYGSQWKVFDRLISASKVLD